MTFAEFDGLVDRAAAALHDNGFGPGDRVALLAHNCWQYAVLAFATARAAVVLVPINFMLTAEEIAYILGHCRATGFIVEPTLIDVAEEAMRLGGDVTSRIALTAAGDAAPARLGRLRAVADHHVTGADTRRSATTNCCA